jgi:PAS domain S-box-containing protein
MKDSWLKRIVRLWQRMAEPSPNILDANKRTQARMFASILSIGALLTTCIALFFIGSDLLHGELKPQTISTVFTAVSIYALVWMSRRGHHQVAIVILMLYSAPANFLIVVAQDTDLILQTFDYTSLVAIFGSLFISRRIMLGVFLYSAAWMLATPVFTQNITFAEVIGGPVVFNAAVFALSSIGTSYFRHTERQQRQAIAASEARYRRLVEDMNDMILSIDKKGILTDVAGGFERMGGWTREELLGKPIVEFLHPDDLMVIANAEAAARNGQLKALITLRYRHKDGSYRDAEMNLSYSSVGGRLQGAMGVGRDVTERKRSEQQQLALSLFAERMAMMRRFVSSISHDFRTSLAQIETSSYLAKRALMRGEADPAETKLDDIRASVSHMAEQLSNLTTVTSLSELHLLPCDINGIMQGLAASHKGDANAKEIELLCQLEDDIPLVQIDEQKLTSAMQHLLKNAITHTPAGGCIILRTGIEQGMAQMMVIDTGAGIAPDHINNVFDLFYRVDSARRVDLGGVGLGLSIVKLVAEAHGGSAEVESMLGMGSCFVVALPFKHHAV